MKQHDLLKILNDTYPNVFIVTFVMKDKKVTISASNSYWSKVYDTDHFMKRPLVELSEEILNDYHNARNLQKKSKYHTRVPSAH